MAIWTLTIPSTRASLPHGFFYYSLRPQLRFILVFDVSISKEEAGMGKSIGTMKNSQM